MDGPIDHRATAVAQLAYAAEYRVGEGGDDAGVALQVAIAQVHATLAASAPVADVSAELLAARATVSLQARELADLRAAVRDVLDYGPTFDHPDGTGVIVLPDAVARLRGLVQ